MADLAKGKVALVTGAGSGIGRATAQIFSREGAQVAVADVNVEGAQETISLINDAGGEAFCIKSRCVQSSRSRSYGKQRRRKIWPTGLCV